jgi:hypothetical protein
MGSCAMGWKIFINWLSGGWMDSTWAGFPSAKKGA